MGDGESHAEMTRKLERSGDRRGRDAFWDLNSRYCNYDTLTSFIS